MALLERVGTLLRANVNDLIDRAEDPEKMVKQVILDMENQLMQVKTQVAITITDLHLLESRRDENARRHDEWMRKAQMAVAKHQDDLARVAIERGIESRNLAESFEEQIADQRTQAEDLKAAFRNLEAKLADARTKADLLMAKHRRARAGHRAADAQANVEAGSTSAAWDRMKRKVNRAEALVEARVELNGENVEEQFLAMERQDEVEKLLADLKGRKEG